jgi:hypothetical protein
VATSISLPNFLTAFSCSSSQVSLNLFKNKSNKEDFQALLEATSKLRKEQEQDAKLNEKERELTQMIEFYE